MKISKEEIYGIEFDNLETERLILREINPENIRKIFSQLKDDQIMELLGIETEENLEREKRNLEKGIETYYITFKKWALILKESGFIIGFCNYHTWCPAHFRSEIGYSLKEEEHKNRGYMSEAMEAILEFGFEKMNLNRVDAYISPDNYASQNLIKKFNFKNEGCHSEDYLIGDIFHDSVVFALLKRDYFKNR